MKKGWTREERDDLCAKLEGILGADLDDDERDAIYDAISIISPGYAAALERWEDDATEYAQGIVSDILAERERPDEGNK